MEFTQDRILQRKLAAIEKAITEDFRELTTGKTRKFMKNQGYILI